MAEIHHFPDPFGIMAHRLLFVNHVGQVAQRPSFQTDLGREIGQKRFPKIAFVKALNTLGTR
ncbi:hypothetical protein ACO22_04083 [Paracoccidioides brasiliensis]|uniref:Uncharacterized protein n=1 Tax=Paracoccidioides brasiliensis TaxID=121759 RepID=A0A1D2JE38_PARBR|nr:hypothetical protein ACO22_04083 [Paracoccidioides brasiliensis]ODH51426.1 hypothetical protein GX48_02482 [Paracoccidioides brasiliensis]